MWIQDSSAHYQYNTTEGAEEYARLLPSGGHTIFLDHGQSGGLTHSAVYTVTLFHQLKCLDIIRQQFAAITDGSPALVQHCLNYLRQIILCYPNLRLEPATNAAGNAMRGYDTVCRDWKVIYEEAERNHKIMNQGKKLT